MTIDKKPKYEYKVYDTAAILLTSGWYSRADIEQLLQAFDHMDASVKRSMEETKNVRQPKT
jgi:hypothetical protein